MFYPISTFDLLGPNYFFYSVEEKTNIELLLTRTASILNILFLVILIIIIILLAIMYIKNSAKPELSGMGLILLGLILTLIKLPLISWLPVVIGGIFLLIYRTNED